MSADFNIFCSSSYHLFSSKNFLSRCIPDAVTDQANVVGGLFSSSGAESFFEELMGDLQNCGPQLAQMGVVALVFSLIITLLFRFLAGFIVYAIIGMYVTKQGRQISGYALNVTRK